MTIKLRLLAAAALVWISPAFAHCDTLDGPVVLAARKALADLYFFETLVRVHRAGEGAPYTGLKPAGTVEPPVAAADRAIDTGKLQPLAGLIAARTEKGLHAHFDAVMAKKKYAPADVEAGRAYSSAYVEFVHYAERLYEAAETMAPDAAHKH